MSTLLAMTSAFAVSVVCIAVMLIASARKQKARLELGLLETAVTSLRAHYRAMEQLDDPEMPPELLDVAISLSKIVNDHNAVKRLIAGIAFLDQDPFPMNENEARARALFQELDRRRPDLARAFTQATMMALVSVVSRWPETLDALRDLTLHVGVEPVDETIKVVRYSKDRTPHTGVLVPIAA